MANILIVSDNEILNQLYAANLEVYLDAKVISEKKIDQIGKILTNPFIKIVIVQNSIEGVDISHKLYEIIQKANLSIKIFVIGRPTEELLDVEIIDHPYNIQQLVKNAAHVLGVTAKEMVEKEFPNYYPVQLKMLSQLREIPCNVYIKLKDENFTIIANKGDEIVNILAELKNQGVETFFIHSNNRLVFINSLTANLISFLKNTQGLESNVKNEMVKNGFNLIVESFSQNKEVNEEILNLATKCSKVMDEIVAETPSLKRLIDLLESSKDGYVYTHSILCAYVSRHIIKNVSWGGDSHIEKINFVLFFHDIMLAPVYAKYPHLKYEEDIIFDSEISDKDKEIVLNHARLAAELLVTFKRAPIGIDLLIKQHHGMTNGVGFAIDFKDDISPISKVILVAEAFIEEFMRKVDEQNDYKVNTSELISLLHAKFKRPTYKKIIETLNGITI